MTERVVNFTPTGKRVKHGSHGGYRNHGCRCALCRAAARDYQRAYTHRTGRRTPMDVYQAGRPTPTHGGQYMYNQRGCRCDVCVEAARVRRNAEREKQRSKPIPNHVHGTINGYTNWACRCDLCCEVQRKRYRTQRLALRRTHAEASDD